MLAARECESIKQSRYTYHGKRQQQQPSRSCAKASSDSNAMQSNVAAGSVHGKGFESSHSRH
eukprot:5329482-Amphidinium_carterae.1